MVLWVGGGWQQQYFPDDVLPQLSLKGSTQLSTSPLEWGRVLPSRGVGRPLYLERVVRNRDMKYNLWYRDM